MRRTLRAIAVAVLLALAAGGAASILDDACRGLDPDSWIYWFLGCKDKDAAGGGGSGAG